MTYFTKVTNAVGLGEDGVLFIKLELARSESNEILEINLLRKVPVKCMIKLLGGGRGGGWGGCSSGRCLKWGGGGVEVIKGFFQKHLKTWGWVKVKVVRRGEGFWRCHHPCLPPENFNHTPS